jgi:PAS domain S-box-containing protein
MSDAKKQKAALESALANPTSDGHDHDLHTLMDAISDLALVATLDGRILFANQVLRRKLGHNAKALAKMRILDLLPLSQREANAGVVAALLHGAQSSRGLPLAAKGRTEVQVMPRVWLGRWKESSCLFCVFKDLSAEVEVQHQFECLFRNSPSLMAIASLPDRHFVDINDEALDRLGYFRDEVIGKTSRELGLFADLGQQAALTTMIETAAPIVDLEVQIRCKDGAIRDGLLSADVISHGGQRHLLTRIVDITARKRAEKALRATNTELKAQSDAAQETASEATSADRAKIEFLAKMSHEIRTPMNAVLGFTDLLLTTNPSEEQRQYLDMVKERSLDLARIVDEILDLARIEADQVGLVDEPFSVAETVVRCLASVKPDAEKKGLILRSAIADDVPATLGGDSLRLRKVLLNLLTNAVKFTVEGTIDLRVACLVPSGPQCGLSFVVTDTGIGIPLPRQQAIFEPFIQAEETTVRNFGGTGLGLTICRRLVEKMGGEIGVQSQPKQGSVFAFTAFFRRIVAPSTTPSTP